jgi:ribosomal protein S18 acetylase RimI-like enzyme
MQTKPIITPQKHTQQLNFLEILEKMSHIPGWEILKTQDILAMKAPVNEPLINLVWGTPDLANQQAVDKFYNGKSYYWLTQNIIQDLILPNFINPEQFSEMAINLTSYTPATILPNIKVISPTSEYDLQLWAETAIDTFGFDLKEFKNFFYPLIKITGCIPFLAFYDNKPAATALVYCGKSEAAIYAMSTKENFRRNGLGSAVAHACLSLAKSKNLNYAVLYASELGQYLYTQLGFTVTQTLYEYFFKKND